MKTYSYSETDKYLKELLKRIGSGNFPIVTFIESMADQESGFEIGMKTRIKSMEIDFAEGGDIVYLLRTDFSEFEEYNKEFSIPDWMDNNGNPTLKWHESTFYSSNCCESFCVSNDQEKLPFEERDMSQAFQDYLENESKIPYILWLEDRYHSMQAVRDLNKMLVEK